MHVRTNLRARTALLLSAPLALFLFGCDSTTGVDPSGGGASPSGSSSSGGPPGSFSFFVTSLKAMTEQSGSASGFGGDLRFGETGPGAGLRGADKLCATIAEKSMPGAGSKQWRAFLSAVAGEDGNQVNAIDRIGEGPWYDRVGRLFAMSKADLMADRPMGADLAIVNDFPNEDGVPNHQPDPSQPEVDNHDMLTGTNTKGMLFGPSSTCKDWTSATGDIAAEGRPRVGHSWPRLGGTMDGDGGIIMFGDGGPPPPPDGGGMGFGDGGPPPPPDGGFPFGDGGMGTFGSGNNWMSALDESGCAPGVNIVEMGPPDPNSNTVGSGGGYGGIYCFALTP